MSPLSNAAARSLTRDAADPEPPDADLPRRLAPTAIRGVSDHIRVAIVDTQAAVRERLRLLLDRASDVEIVGTGETHGDVTALADAAAPDLMFLGIRVPDLNGLAAIEAVPAARRPAVIFLADREDYACRAFELQALDYLLCPVDDARFEQAMWRARRELLPDARRVMSALGAIRAAQASPRRLIVKSPGQLTFIELDEIDWIESAGNYVRVHTGNVAHLARETMAGMEARLDARFLRVHRSAIVNATRISRICTDRSGRVCVVCKDGTEVAAGAYIDRQLTEWMTNAC